MDRVEAPVLLAAGRAAPQARAEDVLEEDLALEVRISKISKILAEFRNFLQIFGGLVLGCIKTKFCKKICV